ncbi:GH1 family beta-glucosidase [Pseudovibrio sp. SPO723]|uniref:GH1 family beta-glucosidase n=1 Tax=Nesiotobacter zosterae TaxID=392721 RepID=UPI0029C57602|nr:GH1 family beta-glucosidase [Pseudovibrio sp. SPO723]MDX5595172.1 GH1 family beta-glucosidase [Pseudovibrio sp. SPO723]
MNNIKHLAQRFPRDFKFGVATAAYQIEGAAQEDGRKPSIWDAFSKMPGRVYQQHSGDVACDHYHRWESDLDLIKSLGVDAYRFSIAWPRILPDGRGKVNEKGLDFYDRLIDGMKERGLGVFPTLYHWDLPIELAGYGGWTARNTAEAFAEYTEVVVNRLGDRMDALATMNEPWCICYLSHLLGIHAPGEKSIDAAMAAIHVMNLAHGMGVQAARSVRSDLPMGIVLNLMSVYPGSSEPADLAAAERSFLFNNGVFLSPIFKGEYDAEILAEFGEKLPIQDGDLEIINQPLDWWGMNYYNPSKVKDDPAPDAAYPRALPVPVTDSDVRTDIGWEIHEAGLSYVMKQVYDRYDLPPVYITENGACFNDEPVDGVVDDKKRIDYLDRHLRVCAEITEMGLPLKGYFLWSLMDNFEWAEGYRMRFGIVHVNYETQERTLKNSAHWYRSLIETHHSPERAEKLEEI